MKSLNNIRIVTGGELHAEGTITTGRIRFSNADVWEYSMDDGSSWHEFSSDVRLASNTCYVSDSGDDEKAEIGSISKSFATIAGAINIAKDLPNTIIEVLPGTYVLDEETYPTGLMYPNSSYDYYFHENSIINYYGTYGFYITNNGGGNILGKATFNIYNDTFSYNGFGFYFAASEDRKIEFESMNFLSSESTANGVLIDTCDGVLRVEGKITNNGGITVKCGAYARAYFNGGYIKNTSNSKTLIIDSVRDVVFDDMKIVGDGSYNSHSADIMTEITFDGNNNSLIYFNNSHFLFII